MGRCAAAGRESGLQRGEGRRGGNARSGDREWRRRVGGLQRGEGRGQRQARGQMIAAEAGGRLMDATPVQGCKHTRPALGQAHQPTPT